MKKTTKLAWEIVLSGLGSAIETAKNGLDDLAVEEQEKLLKEAEASEAAEDK